MCVFLQCPSVNQYGMIDGNQWRFPFHLLAVVSHFQGYIDPEKVGSADSAQPSAGGSGMSLPLDPSVLSHNLGVPLVVVGTKVSN